MLARIKVAKNPNLQSRGKGRGGSCACRGPLHAGTNHICLHAEGGGRNGRWASPTTMIRYDAEARANFKVCIWARESKPYHSIG